MHDGDDGLGAEQWAAPERRSDEALVDRARAGDDAAIDELLARYRGLTRNRAAGYYLVGADREDLVQEGMIGLFKAVRDYAPGRGSSFRTFAELCVGRQIVSAIKAATRGKHRPLNGYVSISTSAEVDDGDAVLADVLLGSHGDDPADLVISAERLRALQRHLDDALSDLEAQVLRLYVDGKSYVEIAAMLRRHVKAVDNALQRIKRKLGSHLQAQDIADAG